MRSIHHSAGGSTAGTPKTPTKKTPVVTEVDVDSPQFKAFVQKAIQAEIRSVEDTIGAAAADAIRNDSKLLAELKAAAQVTFANLGSALDEMSVKQREELLCKLESGTAIDVEALRPVVLEALGQEGAVRETRMRNELEEQLGALDVRKHPGTGFTAMFREIGSDFTWLYTRPVGSWKRVSLTFVLAFSLTSVLSHTLLARFSWAQHWAWRYGVPALLTVANEFIAWRVRTAIYGKPEKKEVKAKPAEVVEPTAAG